VRKSLTDWPRIRDELDYFSSIYSIFFGMQKKFSFGNCNHHCCWRCFAATFWHKGCVAGARPRPHPHPFPVPVTASALQLRQRISGFLFLAALFS